MSRSFAPPFLVLLASAMLCFATFPASASAEEDAPDPGVPRTHSLGLSIGWQAPLDVPDKLGLGGGITYLREYFVSERFGLGIHMAVRAFPDAPAHLAFGYGLTMRHYVSPPREGEGPRTGLFLMYGLLMQLNWLADRTGTATGHDTWLSMGYEWESAAGSAHWFVQGGYHLTQVRSFDDDTLWWPYTDVLVGITWE